MCVKRKLCRTDCGREDRESEKNVVRGHALFVRFMERKELGDCVHYFPDGMTLGQLRLTTPRDLMNKFNVRDRRDRDRIMRLIEECHGEGPSSDLASPLIDLFHFQFIPSVRLNGGNVYRMIRRQSHRSPYQLTLQLYVTSIM
ncbi:hypothetical protein LSH36_266g03031 [Paralvinella palmiformis]|uniref:Uncharacterized protein n=1 Tax=Paralvinella palmiformis TaxID=53620 RepID=A0AAD9JJV7_9ANNE|nr:hypothetical protein LSH36_266g03031 [Paralvinella palmiformis]